MKEIPLLTIKLWTAHELLNNDVRPDGDLKLVEYMSLKQLAKGEIMEVKTPSIS